MLMFVCCFRPVQIFLVGAKILCLLLWKILYLKSFILVHKINSRHQFLSRFITTKEKEDISFENANVFNLWITLTSCICCLFEAVLYAIYNRKVYILTFDFINIIFNGIFILASSMAENCWRGE